VQGVSKVEISLGKKRLSEVQDITERILYRLSLDPKARALAERLLGRFRCLAGNLQPAPATTIWADNVDRASISTKVGMTVSSLKLIEFPCVNACTTPWLHGHLDSV